MPDLDIADDEYQVFKNEPFSDNLVIQTLCQDEAEWKRNAKDEAATFSSIFLRREANNWHDFGLKGKLSPRFIGSFEILESVGDLAYRVALSTYLSNIHDVFHVSLLRWYATDESHVLHPLEVRLNEDLTYVEIPIYILYRKSKELRNKTIPLVLVQWQRRDTKEDT
ncbi:uncharacterized protein [Henckelia pumila]|uniref:uncharacterized protein n=1 Tax=Henckelia pumila TaxID=405737 RepID=UPI003C6DB939